MTCKNCSRDIDGNFCKHCGQNTKVDKIDLLYFINDLSDTVFKVDKGLFFTLQQLFVRPGSCIKDYLNGKRVSYFKPIAYVFALSTIYFLIAKLLGSSTFLNDFMTGFSEFDNASEGAKSHLRILNWFVQNYAITMLMLLPLFACASYLMFFKAGFNYLEHLVLNAYITGQQTIFYSITAFIGVVSDSQDLWGSLTVFISMTYNFVVYWQFFSEQGRISVIWRLISTYILYMAMIMVVMSVILFAFFL